MTEQYTKNDEITACISLLKTLSEKGRITRIQKNGNLKIGITLKVEFTELTEATVVSDIKAILASNGIMV